MKKILHILSQRPEKTGSGIYLQSLLKEGNKKGYEQAVIAGVPANIEKVDLGNIDKGDFFPVKFNTKKLPFPVVGMSDVMPYPSTKYRELNSEMLKKYKNQFKDTIIKAIDEFQPDLILSNHLWILTSLVKQLARNIKVIGVSHGTGVRQLKKLNKYQDYVVEGCQDLDLVFALNNYQKKEIERLYNIPENKIIVMGAGYNSEIFYESQKSNCTKTIDIVYAGKLSYAKGVKFLIKAFEKLDRQREQKFSLKLFGEGSGEEFAEINNLVQNSKSNIELVGSVPQQKLAEEFRKSDIFCLPSFYEGLALVVIEALASGLRIVTTDLPGIKNWLGNEINKSGVIEYIELPRLKNTDIPHNEDLEQFVESLKKGLAIQVDKQPLLENEELKTKVKKLSWEGVFSRMEKYF